MTSPASYNSEIIQEFRANGGQVGGGFAGAPLLLLHTVGARTGTERVTPLMYLPVGERFIVFASKAGADTHPDWYHNLLADPNVQIEVDDRTLDVHAIELHGSERDDRYAEQARRYPGFADYEEKTSRVIPVIALTPKQAPPPDSGQA
ncbi:MAG: nitroreductase family deazaflavin-dependent oxidoreductase [Actinomycetota bacterium]|nr:nitroreductase family deazaflavin-dependent oxidoreductase [Actinomycetota bacterium]